MAISDFLMRICAALLAGTVIGIERQLTGHPAGVRINALVSLGSCIFALFALIIPAGLGSMDPSRMASQIVTGVGFLCSALIFKEGTSVHGLNTAATIWCIAAIGILASTGQYLIVFIATAVLLAANLLLRPFSDRLEPVNSMSEVDHVYQISVVCAAKEAIPIRNSIIRYMAKTKLRLVKLESGDIVGGKAEVIAAVSCRGRSREGVVEKLVTHLHAHQDVISIGWKMV